MRHCANCGMAFRPKRKEQIYHNLVCARIKGAKKKRKLERLMFAQTILDALKDELARMEGELRRQEENGPANYAGPIAEL